MASVSRSTASIRFFGDTLDPAEITRALGAEPTTQYRKGDKRKSYDGREYHRRFGAWLIAAEEREPEAIDEQLSGLFARLNPDLQVWASLTSHYDADVFCGLFMVESNEGFSLRPETLRALADRNLEIGFDIYDPDDDKSASEARPDEV